MMDDFTYEVYQSLLDAGRKNGYEFVTVRDSFKRNSLPERTLIIRHDVDRKPENSLDMANFEAARGIQTTYYFRTIEKTFRPRIIKKIEELGHEIGYHYEDLDRAAGSIELGHRSFETHLRLLRGITPIETICMHGNPLTRHDNRDLWKNGHNYSRYGLVGEAYLSMDFNEISYYSDTGRTWQDGPLKVKDHTMGEGSKEYQVRTTEQLIELLDTHSISRACLLIHHNRW